MSLIKKVMSLALSAAILAGSASCSKKTQSESSESSKADSTEKSAVTTNEETSETSAAEKKSPFGKAVVVYFSCTGNTRGVASKIAADLGCVSYEIIPSKPYSAEDLNYNNKKSRAAKEHNDAKARPEIAGDITDWSSYDTVFIGYPIWFGQAPKILLTFVENHDFEGKRVIPFCTSGSSGIGTSVSVLEKAAKNGGTWSSGTRFASSVSSKDISEWLESLGKS